MDIYHILNDDQIVHRDKDSDDRDHSGARYDHLGGNHDKDGDDLDHLGGH